MAMNLAADKVAFTTLFRNPLQVLRSPASYWEFTKDEYFLPFRENSLESFVIYNETLGGIKSCSLFSRDIKEN